MVILANLRPDACISAEVSGRSNGDTSSDVFGNARLANFINQESLTGSWSMARPPGFRIRWSSWIARSRS